VRLSLVCVHGSTAAPKYTEWRLRTVGHRELRRVGERDELFRPLRAHSDIIPADRVRRRILAAASRGKELDFDRLHSLGLWYTRFRPHEIFSGDSGTQSTVHHTSKVIDARSYA
jgi:hypothetical protein